MVTILAAGDLLELHRRTGIRAGIVRDHYVDNARVCRAAEVVNLLLQSLESAARYLVALNFLNELVLERGLELGWWRVFSRDNCVLRHFSELCYWEAQQA